MRFCKMAYKKLTKILNTIPGNRVSTQRQKKLSKSHGDKISIQGNKAALWVEALKFLGQPILPEYASSNIKEIIPEAIKKWSINHIPKSTSIEVDAHIHT